MSTPRSWAKIEFPVSRINDEIREKLGENDMVQFNEDGSLKDWHGVDIEVEAGIFTLEDGEAAYGEFEELEALLIEKGIPFDRESGMDWNRKPVRLVYRPVQGDKAALELNIDLDDDGDEVVSVKAIREVASMGITGAVTNFLNKHFPAYPPLADFVTKG